MDWSSTNREDIFKCDVIDVNDGRIIRSLSDNVVWNDFSLTEGYFSDTRVNANLTIRGYYETNGFIRITHTVPEMNYRKTLGTFLVWNEPYNKSRGQESTKLTLYSLLYGLKTQKGRRPLAITKGAYVNDIIKGIIRDSKVKVRFVNSNNYRFSGGTVMMETGTTLLSRLAKACDMTGNRYYVDENGTLVITKHLKPNQKPSTFTLHAGGGDDRIVYDGISRDTDALHTPNEAIAYREWTTTDKKVQHKHLVTGSARTNTGPRWAINRRGFIISSTISINDENVTKQNQVDSAAKSLLSRNNHYTTRWTLTCLYFPCHAGDVGTLYIHDVNDQQAQKKRVMIQSISLDVNPMHMELVLAEDTGYEGESDQYE